MKSLGELLRGLKKNKADSENDAVPVQPVEKPALSPEVKRRIKFLNENFTPQGIYARKVKGKVVRIRHCQELKYLLCLPLNKISDEITELMILEGDLDDCSFPERDLTLPYVDASIGVRNYYEILRGLVDGKP